MQAGEGGGASEHERRHVQHARLLGQQQPLRRRRARRRADLPRRLQPRADRSVLGADRLRRRPDQRRRLHQPRRPKRRTWKSAQAGTLSYGAGDQVRATLDVNQPVALGERGTFLGQCRLPRQRVVAGRWHGRPRLRRARKQVDCARRSPSASTPPTRASLCGQIMRQDNLADYGLPAAASPIGPLTSDLDRGRHARRAVELLRQSGLRLRQRQPGQRHAARSSTTSRRA